MYFVIFIAAVLLGTTIANQTARTRMVVLDAGTATAYRVELGLNISDYTITAYQVPALSRSQDVDYDFVDDRLYILQNWNTIKSVFVNGSDERHLADLEQDSYALAVDPYEKVVFASLLRRRNVPAKIISMNIDGSNLTTLLERRMESPNMAVDYQRKYLYWMEFLCSCLYRMRYNGEGFEKFARRIFVKKSPHAVDFENNLLYGDARRGLYKVSLDRGRENLIYRYQSDALDQTVFDPRTNRLFLTNNDHSSDVTVVKADGTFVGIMDGLQLTADDRKFVRINPL